MKRILVVDDSETARMFVRRCLEAIGFKEAAFSEAENGQQALEQMAKDPVDLLVTDLTMPVLDGVGLVKTMRGEPRYKDTKIIIISSAGNMARKRELLELGAMAVLPKPFAPADMYKVLYSFIPGA